MLEEKKRPNVGLAAIVCKGDQVLLGRRTGAHGADTWGFPGGHLEWNESFVDCARRETFEEAGIEIENIELFHTTNDCMHGDNRHYVTVFMRADHAGGVAAICEPDKTHEWQWFRWDELPRPLFLPIENLIKDGLNPLAPLAPHSWGEATQQVSLPDMGEREGAGESQELVDLIGRTEQFVRGKLEGAESGHGWYHIERVWKVAKDLASREKDVDIQVVELAALLHDIADWKFHDGDQEAGPREARQWLESIEAPEELVRHTCDIIRHISYKGANVENTISTKEGMIVQDADRLDALGAIGIARTFAYGGAKNYQIYNPNIKPTSHASAEDYRNDNGHSINHFYEKLLLLKDRMNTDAARKIAEERHSFLERYLKQFFKEWEAAPRTYNKLVRDLIPDIIHANGDAAVTHLADEVEYWDSLVAKLHEELDEFIAEPSAEELADMLEVMYGICALKGWGIDVLERTRRDKLARRGGFSKRIILEKTT